MSADEKSLDVEFFGTVTASISHDINNRLAVINENAGLIEDLLSLSARGQSLNPERLHQIVAKVKENVSRANKIVKTLNRFAHSADHPVVSVDLCDAIDLSASLFRRKAQIRDVSVVVDTGENDPTIETSLYHFLNLLWICMDAAVERTRPGGKIAISLAQSGGQPSISISSSQSAAEGKSTDLQGYASTLAGRLGLHLNAFGTDDTIVITRT
jgi:C4-dicarboxylate-specific signal transduction histidine kinase